MRTFSILAVWLVALNAVTAALKAPVAAAPVGETVSQITWQWTDSNFTRDGYRVYDSATATTPLQTVKASSGSSAGEWTETGLVAGTRYTRYVSTYLGADESARTQLQSAMASFPVIWHPTNSVQSRAVADTYIASAFATNSYPAEESLRCGYTSALGVRRSLVQFEQSTLPAATLWRAGLGRARLKMYISAGTDGTLISGYKVSLNWDEVTTVPAWNSFFTATNGGSFTGCTTGDAGKLWLWQWDPAVAGMPEQGRGVMFIGSEQSGDATYAKAFASKDNTNGWPAPVMSLEYYLPVNPQWVTQMLVLPGVGGASLDAAAYATDAGLTGDTDMYGSSRKSYGNKTWRVATGDYKDVAGFSDHYGWTLSGTGSPFGISNNICALFNLYVFSDITASGCYLRCGSADGVRVIVNGTVVGTDDFTRKWDMEQSVFGPFDINAGWNRVLVKVRKGTGDSGLKAVRFSNADATVWSGSSLRFAADDTTPPTNPSSCAEGGGAQSGVWQNTASLPSFAWSGSADIAANGEGASGIRGYKVYYGTSASGTPTVLQTAAAYAPSAQGDGVYYLRVSTVDKAMNESDAVTLFTYQCDRTSPTGVSLGFGPITVNSITVTGAGADALSGIDASTGFVYSLGGVPDSDRQGAAYVWNGLSPNTRYNGLSVTVSDRAGNATASAAQSKWTLSVPPSAGSVVANDSAPCANNPVTWTANAGFGAGTVQYYRYAWNQSATYAWTEGEPQWASGGLVTTPTTGGIWYLHLRGYNGENVANGSYDYALVVNASPVAQNKTLSTSKNTATTITVGKLLAGATGAASVAGVATTTPGAAVTLAGGVVTYSPPTDFTGTDTFTFSLVSSVGCSGNGTVTVSVGTNNGESPNVVYAGTEGNQFVARFAGIPGETYTIEAAESANGPWFKIGTNVRVSTTDQGWGVGVFEIRDQMSNGRGFYRTVWPAY